MTHADRNAIIEQCAAVVDACNREGPYNAIAAAKRIRSLKATDGDELYFNVPMRPLKAYWNCGGHKLDDEMRRIAGEAMRPANNDRRVAFARIVAERVGIPNAMSGEVEVSAVKDHSIAMHFKVVYPGDGIFRSHVEFALLKHMVMIKEIEVSIPRRAP